MIARWILILVGAGLLLQSCNNVNYEQEEFSPETIGLLNQLKPQMTERGQFRLYYPKESIAAENLDAAVEQIEFSKGKVLAILKEREYTAPINILLVDSQQQVASLTDLNNAEFTIPPDRFSIVVFDAEREALFTRSLFKIMSFHFWGTPRDQVMFEGGAAFAQGTCAAISNPIDQIPAAAIQEGSICSIRDLVFEFPNCLADHPVTTRMQSASIFRLLYDGFDLETTKELWTGGLRNIERIVGMTPSDLAREWKFIMDNVTIEQEIDLEELNANGCH